jgi:L-asparagine transporter-like permease
MSPPPGAAGVPAARPSGGAAAGHGGHPRSLPAFSRIIEREQGLQRALGSRQLTMIAIGGAIGTGLFLGSGAAISLAGPAVLLSYALGALIAFLLMGCLAEMSIAHPVPGSFGAYAEHYIGPLAGFLVRYAYWTCVVLAVGTEVTAVATYMRWWLADVPGWIWIVGFSALLVQVNAVSVQLFGGVEYGLSMIKVAAIVAFLVLGSYVLLHGAPAAATGTLAPGFQNYIAHGGFLPGGLWGMWTAVIVAIFSYLSIEMIAVAAAEAVEPEIAVARAFRSTVLRLVLFYLLTLALMLALVPWTQLSGTEESPFVQVMRALHIPAAAHVMNGVILIAALSAMNSQLYITTRMLFSLARAGDAPRQLGALTARGVPRNALLASTAGIALAAVLSVVSPQDAFTWMLAISSFGALFTWMMIFVTYLFFRRARSREGLAGPVYSTPAAAVLGAALIAASLLSTPFTQTFRLTLLFGIPFLASLVLAHELRAAARARRAIRAGRPAPPG